MAQETIILEADLVEEATDAVLKEHAIPALLSNDLSHLLLEASNCEEADSKGIGGGMASVALNREAGGHEDPYEEGEEADDDEEDQEE